MGRGIRILAAAILWSGAGIFAAGAGDISEDILSRAIDAYKAGEVEPAIGGINAAMRGRLPGSLTAKAHYYRGLAYRISGRPGDAIVDLTRALQYSGLTDAERSDASENLEVAYQEAGIAPNEKVVVAQTGKSEPEKASPAKAPEKQSESWPAVAVTGSVDEKAPAAAPPAKKVEAAGPWSTATAAAPARRPDPVPVPAPAAVKAEPREASPAKWSSQQVALAPLPPVPAVKKSSPEAKAVAGTPVAKPVRAEPAIRLAAATPALAPFATEVTAAPPAPPSEVRLLIGETHSRSEAVALAVRLTSQRGAGLGPRRPQVIEARYADASVYRLMLGPFTLPDQAMTLCRSLRDSGYACVWE